MKTADEIRNVDFVKSAFGGYRQTDVEIYLDDIADDMQKLIDENKELNRKCADLQSKIEDFQCSETSLQSILMSAQKLADSIVAEAKATAEAVLEKTGEQAAEILTEANNNAETMKTKAEAEATRILGEAVQKSNLLISGAEERAKNQLDLLNTYKAETAEFKNEIIEKYKAQLELILSLPEVAPISVPKVAEDPIVEEQPESIEEEVVAEDVESEKLIDEEINLDEITEDGFFVVKDDEEEEF